MIVNIKYYTDGMLVIICPANISKLPKYKLYKLITHTCIGEVGVYRTDLTYNDKKLYGRRDFYTKFIAEPSEFEGGWW